MCTFAFAFKAERSFGRGARHRSAKPATPVQIRKRPQERLHSESLFLSPYQTDSPGQKLASVGSHLVDISAAIDINACRTRLTQMSPIPRMVEVGSMIHQYAATIVNPQLVLSNTTAQRSKSVILRLVWNKRIGEGNHTFRKWDNAIGCINTSRIVGFHHHLDAVAHPWLHWEHLLDPTPGLPLSIDIP